MAIAGAVGLRQAKNGERLARKTHWVRVVLLSKLLPPELSNAIDGKKEATSET